MSQVCWLLPILWQLGLVGREITVTVNGILCKVIAKKLALFHAENVGQSVTLVQMINT